MSRYTKYSPVHFDNTFSNNLATPRKRTTQPINHGGPSETVDSRHKIEICNLNTNFGSKNLLKGNTNISRFSGKDGITLTDWLRQFTVYLKVPGTGYDEESLQHLAASHLSGEAGKYYDGLPKEPETWQEFIKVMTKRYGIPKMDKPQIYRKFLNTTQKKDECTRTHAENMRKMGESAEMDRVMIIQSIIGNMLPEKRIHYRLHIKDNYTFHELFRLIDIIELDENLDKNGSYKIPERTLDDEFEEVWEKLDKISFTVNNHLNQKKYRQTEVRCRKCGKRGHSSFDCFSKRTNSEKTHRINEKRVYDRDNSTDKSLGTIENLLKQRIPETLGEFSKIIPKRRNFLTNF